MWRTLRGELLCHESAHVSSREYDSRMDLRSTGNVIHVVAKSHEEVEEQLTPTGMHLQLHGSTTLERVPTADDECEVMCSKFGVAVGRVGVGVAGRGEDRTALDAGLEALLPQCHSLQLFQSVLLRRAVDDGVLEDISIDPMMVDGGLDGTTPIVAHLELPAIPSLVLHQPWIVVSFVEILEDRREDFRLFVG